MSEILRTPIEGPAAWMAADFAGDTSWMYKFSAAEVAEIEAATDSVLTKGLGIGEFGRDDFVLPTLGTRFEEMQHELQHGRGFVQLRGLTVDDQDMDRTRALYWGIGTHFGTAIEQNGAGQLIAEIADRGYQYEDRNVRGYMTNASLRPHQDIWSDTVALLCIRPAKSGGASVVASAESVYNAVLAEHPEYLEALTEGYIHDLRGEGPTGDDLEVTEVPIPVFDYFGGRLSGCINTKANRTALDKTGDPLTDLDIKALDFIEEVALRPEYHFNIDFQPGDIQLLSNLSIMHWRAGFEDDPNARRLLIRLWLNCHESRPLSPELERRAWMGPRRQLNPELSAAIPVNL